MRTRIVLWIAANLILANGFVCEGARKKATEPPLPDGPYLSNSVLTRVAQARIYRHRFWTVPGESPERVAEALIRLRPTLVSGLIRPDGPEIPDEGDKSDKAKAPAPRPANKAAPAPAGLDSAQIKAFDTIRRMVRAKNPGCKFDVTLPADQYAAADELVATMKKINEQIRPDLWFFESFTEVNKDRPDLLAPAIAYAHSQGQAIGGDCASLQLPPEADFGVEEAISFRLNLGRVKRIQSRRHIPVLARLNNQEVSPKKFDEARMFAVEYTTAQRKEALQRLAAGQAEGRYHLMYPLFFPESPPRRSYNAARDGDMLKTLGELMDQYNPLPPEKP